MSLIFNGFPLGHFIQNNQKYLQITQHPYNNILHKYYIFIIINEILHIFK